MSISPVSIVIFPKERRHMDCGGPVVREALMLEPDLRFVKKLTRPKISWEKIYTENA